MLFGGDSVYGGKSVLRRLPGDVDLIRRVAPDAALYRPAPPRRPDLKGASRKEGDRLPGMAEWAADATAWQDLELDRSGPHAELEARTIRALYSKAGKDRRKEEPSYAEILTAPRLESWRGQFAGVDWDQGGPETPLARRVEFVSRVA